MKIKFTLLAVVAVAAVGCAESPRFEFHPHPTPNGIGLWRCDRRTGRVDLVVVGETGQVKWLRLTNAPPVE